MKELSFIIINARDSLSQLMIDELKRRVSFPVYQDSIEEDIWNLLKGAKDDIYLYDRCGRLTFYIPFPLSIIHPQQPIVNAAIHATYYDNLCGESCIIAEMDSAIPSDYQESLDHKYIKENSTNSTDILDVEDIKKILTEEHTNDSVIDNEDKFPFLLNQTNVTIMDNETFLFQNTVEDFNIFNETTMFFGINNESIVSNMTEFTDVINTTLMLNITDVPESVTVQTYTTEERPFWESAYDLFSSNKTIKKKSQLAALEKTEADTELIMKGRCSDPSYEQMCTEWGKKKLWHAHFCCTSTHKVHQFNGHRHCGHYKAKKCKKLQPILKCCLGTVNSPTESSLINEKTTSQEYFVTVG